MLRQDTLPRDTFATSDLRPPTSDFELIESLRSKIRSLESGRPAEQGLPPCSSGCADLDRLLPGGGFARGSLVEWISAEPGSGAATLALMAARQACRQGGALVAIDRGGAFYPPAAAAMGLDLANMVVIRAATEADELWALDGALRCQGVAAVWAPIERLSPHDFRRLQLAAERGGALGLLLRPPQARGLPSWAETQLWVEPRPSASGRRARVEVTRCRGAAAGQAMELELDERLGVARRVSDRHETHPLPEAAALAPAALGLRSAGA